MFPSVKQTSNRIQITTFVNMYWSFVNIYWSFGNILFSLLSISLQSFRYLGSLLKCLSRSTSLSFSLILRGGKWDISNARLWYPGMKIKGLWESLSSNILVAFASINRCVYVFITGSSRVKSSFLSYLGN